MTLLLLAALAAGAPLHGAALAQTTTSTVADPPPVDPSPPAGPPTPPAGGTGTVTTEPAGTTTAPASGGSADAGPSPAPELGAPAPADEPAAGADPPHAGPTIGVPARRRPPAPGGLFDELVPLPRAPKTCGTCPPADAAPQNTLSPDRGDVLPDAQTSKRALRDDGGVPTTADPTLSLTLPGAIPVGVPSFFIDKFRIPPFLLPIYQAAGIQYGVRWEILAAINEIETDYGRNLNISTAGALGWMQFLPDTWKIYGTDGNGDGQKDPFNPVDAIFAAARYLKAAGAERDLRQAIFAYNHADWYVESVLMRARLIGGLPDDIVGSLSGLTQGHFPVFAKARYADDGPHRGIDIFAAAGAPAIAVQDGTITAMGSSERLGRFVTLRDDYGNDYTYSHLKTIAGQVPVPKQRAQSRASIARERELPARDKAPTHAASAGKQPPPAAPGPAAPSAAAKERLFAHPARPRARSNGGSTQIFESGAALGVGQSLRTYFKGLYGLRAKDVVLKRLTPRRRVLAGTILGRIGRNSEKIAPRLHFEIRPAGRGAPRIDPKPILDGWKLLESTALYRAKGTSALLGADSNASVGQIMLMSDDALARHVLANPRIEIYSCGRRDIAAGLVDRRVLATLEFLAASGLVPTVTSLRCGHGAYTADGNVSEHASGNAVDIGKLNGIPVIGHQGAGSISDLAVRRLLTLQGTIKPHQIISLMKYDGTDNTLALPHHADHIHIGFAPDYGPGTPAARRLDAVLKPEQWIKLIERLGRIDNPAVGLGPSKYALPSRP